MYRWKALNQFTQEKRTPWCLLNAGYKVSHCFPLFSSQSKAINQHHYCDVLKNCLNSKDTLFYFWVQKQLSDKINGEKNPHTTHLLPPEIVLYPAACVEDAPWLYALHLNCSLLGEKGVTARRSLQSSCHWWILPPLTKRPWQLLQLKNGVFTQV